MTTSIDPRARKLGFLFIGAGLLVGVPLTATRAVNYVDKVAPAVPVTPTVHAAMTVPVTPAAPSAAALPSPRVAAATTIQSMQAVPTTNADGSVKLPGGVTLGKGDVAFLANDQIIINGKVKRLEDLTRAERAQLRANVARSQADLKQERAELPSRLAEARQELDRIRSGDFKRELLKDREDMHRDLADIDKEAAELRAHGENPEKLKAEILASLREAEAVDVDARIREALVELNPDKIASEVREAEEQLVRISNRLDQLDRQK